MTLLRFKACAVLSVAVLATAALAQEQEQELLQIDAAVDGDGDGLYSYPEMIEAFPEIGVNEFLKIDANEDGRVDPRELAMARAEGMIASAGDPG